jgi:zinc protease
MATNTIGNFNHQTRATNLLWQLFLMCCMTVVLTAYSTAGQAGPKIQHWTTDNGARVYFVDTHELPMVDVRVVFDAGSARDGDKPGLALLTNGLLTEGAGGLDADAIAERMESVGAEYGNDSLRDMAVVTLRSLTDSKLLEPALDTFAKIVQQPDFPAAVLERERQRLLVGLSIQQQKPGEIVEKAFYKALYGKHPYATPPEGDEASVKAIKREDLLAFYRKYYVASNALIAIVGDLSRQQAEQLATRLVKDLPKGKPAAPLPPVPALSRASEETISHPSSQTHIMMGQPGMHRGDPDYYALYLGNHALGGGGLVSRLSEEIREKRGLSYSVYSYFYPMRRNGPFILGLQTKNESASEALSVLRKTLADYVDNGITEKELEASKKNIIGGFPLRLDSNKKITEYIAMIGFYDLPLDYLDTFTGKIQALTLQQVRDAFKRRVLPERMATVIVGNSGKESAK